MMVLSFQHHLPGSGKITHQNNEGITHLSVHILHLVRG